MLKQRYRLTKNASFNYLYKKGLRHSDADLKLYCLKGNSTKIGFSVSNKVGNAVVRNLVKRRLRSIASNLCKDFLYHAQTVVVAMPTAANKSFDELCGSLRNLFKKAGLLAADKQ